MKCLVLILSLFLNFAVQAAGGEPAIGLSIRPGAGGNPDAPPPGPSLSDRQSELDALTKLLQQANPKPEVKKIDWEKIDREEAAAEEAELLAYGEQRRREWAEKPVYVEETKDEKELRQIVKETCGFYDPFFDPAEHIADLYAKRDFVKNQITRMDKREIRERLVKTATETIEVADDLYKKDELEEGWNVARYAHAMLDLATSLTPGISWGRDIFEAISGVDLLTNAPLDTFSRSMAIFGAGTGGIVSKLGLGCKLGRSFKTLRKVLKGEKAEEAIQASKKLVYPELGRKLDYVFGKATGDPHNIERSKEMLRQMERVGLPDGERTRTYISEHLSRTLGDSSSILKTQENGRVIRESLLQGPGGSVKIESIWEGAKLITVKIFGGGR